MVIRTIYDKHMTKLAISVTLESENLTWLRARVGATGARSVSELLDQLVTSARQTGDAGPSRSVVGTIDLSPGDPDLEGADEAVWELFARSLAQPIVLREQSPEYGATRPRKKGRRG